MNFWTALVLIIAIMLVTSLIYNIVKNRHAERMFMLQLEQFKLEKGQIIGREDDNGYSLGTHLHNKITDKKSKSKKVEK